MKSKPIIMGAESIQAILAGHKTQTRRVIAPANSLFDGYPWTKAAKEVKPNWGKAWVDKGPSPAGNPGPYLHLPFPEFGTTHRIYPRLQVGDQLWVRETFSKVPRTAYHHDPSIPHVENGDWWAVYKADWARSTPGAWKSPYHMPRWASRITLEITDLRAERLHKITYEDCLAEGITEEELTDGRFEYFNGQDTLVSAKDEIWASYSFAWDRLNKKRGFPWESNPWVWVIEFKALEPANA